MKVFICWSGNQSKKVAVALHKWIPNVIQGIVPWMSEEDISKGEKWASVLSAELSETNFGIVCLTRENSTNEWMLFETGSLSKEVTASKVVPYLLGISPSDLRGPYTLFQMAEATKDDTFRLIASINKSLPANLSPERLRSSFDKWWPEFEIEINKAKQGGSTKTPTTTHRTENDMLEEVLLRVRNLPRELSEFSTADYSYAKELFNAPRWDDVVDKLPLVSAALDHINTIIEKSKDRTFFGQNYLRGTLAQNCSPAQLTRLNGDLALIDAMGDRYQEASDILVKHFSGDATNNTKLIKELEDLIGID